MIYKVDFKVFYKEMMSLLDSGMNFRKALSIMKVLYGRHN